MSIFSVFCSHCNLVLKSPILASSKSKPQARKTRRKRLTARQKNANAAKPASRPSNGTAKVVDLPLMNESTVHAAQKQHQPYVVGVAGGTASGKTTVCNKIATGLRKGLANDERFVLVPQDSFYRDLSTEEAANVGSYNFDHPDAFNFEEMVACLHALKQGQAVNIPVYDYKLNARREESMHVAQADVVLFDGILAFHNRALRDLMDLKIFVDVDSDTRLARRIRRDIANRGRSINSILDQYESTVKPSHDAFIYPTKAEADIIIPRGAENEPAIELVLQHLKTKLSVRNLTQS